MATQELIQLKQDVLTKMLKEMNEKHTPTEDIIHNWLCDQEDEKLFKGILKDDRTIKGSVEYCASKAREQQTGNVAVIDDETVFSWIRDYFLADEIKAKAVSAKVSVTQSKEKNKPKPKPLEGEQLDLLGFL